MCIKSSYYPWEKMHTIGLSVSGSCLWHSILDFVNLPGWVLWWLSTAFQLQQRSGPVPQQWLFSFTFLAIPMMLRWIHKVVVISVSLKAGFCSTFHIPVTLHTLPFVWHLFILCAYSVIGLIFTVFLFYFDFCYLYRSNINHLSDT